MALLYRFAQLPDSSSTRVFSFVVTRSVIRDPERDVTSKELICGFQRWSVAFSRGNKFTYEAPAQGNRNYISVSDLYNRNFADTNGEFQLELSMANVRTVYMTDLKMPSSTFSAGQSKPNKLETDYFPFGGFDWNLVIYPQGNKEVEGYRGHDAGISVYLMRMSGFDHRCRVKYSVALGEGNRRIDSGQLEDLSAAEQCGLGWHTQAKWSEIAHKGVLRVSLEMMEARTICEVAVQARGPSDLPTTPCYDRDNQAWMIQADLNSDTVRLHFIYKDIHNVPRNHLRLVVLAERISRFVDYDGRNLISLVASVPELVGVSASGRGADQPTGCPVQSLLRARVHGRGHHHGDESRHERGEGESLPVPHGQGAAEDPAGVERELPTVPGDLSQVRRRLPHPQSADETGDHLAASGELQPGEAAVQLSKEPGQPKSARSSVGRSDSGSDCGNDRYTGYYLGYVGQAAHKTRRTTFWETLTGLVCSLGALASRAAKMATRRGEPL
ncbi:unnamed protein product [Heterotrigona itama]|uniref:MATH domain-containing protein n=1 Tax=Heterotrigona itama TaxID=395501 RepID=A0A6V7GYV0_9HYME|nr:unnamed protein product [Heterotrigona itama]